MSKGEAWFAMVMLVFLCISSCADSVKLARIEMRLQRIN